MRQVSDARLRGQAKRNVFQVLSLPGGNQKPIPADIRIELPQTSTLSVGSLQSMAYIPWDDAYLALVPSEYRSFFLFVVPFLSARTTNVHTALSLSFVPELLSTTRQAVDERVLHIAVILHDCGWGQMAEHEIAASLNYAGLAYSDVARRPKERHASLGAELATRLLDEYSTLGITPEAKRYIAELVYYHDQIRPWPIDGAEKQPIEYLLLGDADRLWSYTYENFWLDTIRKHVPAQQYVRTLDAQLESYFLTDQGRAIARRLITEREAEVAQLS